MNTKGRKACLTQCLYTLKDKPSRVNKETEILSKSDAKVHQVYSNLKKYFRFSSPSVLNFYKKVHLVNV